RYLNITLIPRGSEIVTRRLREKRNLDLAAFQIVFVVVAQIPKVIIKREHPGSVCTDLIPETLRLENSRQTNSISQIAIEPLLLNALVVCVQFKAPHPVERNRIGSPCGVKSKEADGERQDDTAWPTKSCS